MDDDIADAIGTIISVAIVMVLAGAWFIFATWLEGHILSYILFRFGIIPQMWDFWLKMAVGWVANEVLSMFRK